MFALLAYVAVTLTIAGFAYSYHIVARWKLRHIPGPPPRALTGNMRDHPPGKLHKSLIAWPRKYGPLLKYFIGHEVFVLVTDAALVQEIAVKAFNKFHDRKQLPMWVSVSPEDDERAKWEILWSRGKFWSTIRAACDPLFHSKSLSSYAPLMHSSISAMMADLDKVNEGASVEVMRPLQQLSLQIIGTAAFGVDFRCQGTEASTLARSARFVLKPPPEKGWFYYLTMTVPSVRGFLSLFIREYGMQQVGFRRLVGSAGFIVGASKALLHNSRVAEKGMAVAGKVPIEQLVPPPPKKKKLPPGLRAQLEAQAAGAKEYEHASPAPNSFFSRLLHTTHREAGNDGKPLTDIQIISQGTVFVIAGYDTSSLALTATLYELAKDQAAQQRLQDEADLYYSAHADEPNYDDLDKFKYTEAAFKEALRMHPPVNPHLVQVRVASEDVVLGGYRIPKGTPVVMNSLGLAYDEKLFPIPENFRPERFLEGSPDGPGTRSAYAYLPFGAGPHKCIGAKFAIEEGVLALVRFHKRYSYTVDPSHHPEDSAFEVRSGITLTPEKGLWLHLKHRA